ATAFGVAATIQLAVMPAASFAANNAPSHAIPATHIKFVYPDSPETSNAPFPPNYDQKAVHSQLHNVIVLTHGRRVRLGDYLRTLRMDPSKVVTVKVQADAIAVYTYLK